MFPDCVWDVTYKQSDIKNAVRFFPYETLRRWLTVHVAKVEVSIDQRSSVVEVLGHVIQPVGLHAFHALVTVLNPERHLDSVVLHLALSDGWMVVQSKQFHPWKDTAEKQKHCYWFNSV